MMDAWQILGIQPSNNRIAIKRAYAKRLKEIHPEDNPEGFQELREAYEFLIEQLREDHELDGLNAIDLSHQEDNTAGITVLEKIKEIAQENHTTTEDDIIQPIFDYSKPETETDQKSSIEIIDSALEELLNLPNNCEISVISEKLNEILNRDEFSSIDMKFDLEESIINALYNSNLPPINIVIAAERIFNWKQQVEQHGHKLNYALNELLERIDAFEYKNELDKKAKRWWTRSGQLAAALTGEFNIWKFRRMTLSTANLKGMSELLDYIDAYHPDFFLYELDEQTVIWWRNAIESSVLSYRKIIFALIGPAIGMIAVLFASKESHLIAVDEVPFYINLSYLLYIPTLIILYYFDKAERLFKEKVVNILSFKWQSYISRLSYDLIFRDRHLYGLLWIFFISILVNEPFSWILLGVGLFLLLILVGRNRFFFIAVLSIFVLKLLDLLQYTDYDAVSDFYDTMSEIGSVVFIVSICFLLLSFSDYLVSMLKKEGLRFLERPNKKLATSSTALVYFLILLPITLLDT